MRPGDFTTLAQAYRHRPGYSDELIDALVDQTGADLGGVTVDVGAGTGKLTSMLSDREAHGLAIEPNAAMRAEGERLQMPGFAWRGGGAEATGLRDESVDWVTMASAFHWTDAPKALAEFHRILKPRGALTLLWNPRDLARDPLQMRIEARIAALAPDVRRRSSGAPAYTETLEDLLLADGRFRRLLFLEAPHVERMSVERHLGAWASVNDVRAQAGEEAWAEIMPAIEEELRGLDHVDVRYRTRAWLVFKS
jgi:SAM-dependent methyltransferase